jgi:hypothetical protein
MAHARRFRRSAKATAPAIFAHAGAVFRQFDMTKNSEPSNSAESISAAHITEIESHRPSLLWIMNPAPQPAAGHTPSVRRFPDSIFGQGCSIRGAPGDFSTESFIIPGMAVGTPHPIRTAFSVSGLPAGPDPHQRPSQSMIRTRRAALAQSAQRFSLATNAERVCAEIMRNQEPKARWRFNRIASRFGFVQRHQIAGPQCAR